MTECIIYHWWQEPDDVEPIHNYRCPLVMSLATLRAHNPNIPVYVLDISEEPANLGELPRRLNFNHVPWKPFLTKYNHTRGWKVLTRMLDIRRFAEQIKENIIIYTDSDVFWKSNPLPLYKDTSKYCTNGYNNGFYYYDKNKVVDFFDVYETFVLTALNDESFRYITSQFAAPNESYFVYDEAISSYIMKRKPELIDRLDLTEHYTVSSTTPETLDCTGAKMIHANGIHVENKTMKDGWRGMYARGLIPLIIQDFYDALSRIIDPREIYSSDEINFHAPLRVPLQVELLQTLCRHKNEKGLYDLIAAINAFHQGNQ